MGWNRCTALLVPLIMSWALPSPAAPTPEERRVARAHYEQAVAHFNASEYGAAADEFRAVYKAVPQAVLLYDAAQAYRLGGDGPRALAFYHAYVQAAPDGGQRPEVERRIRELEAQGARPAAVAAIDRPTATAAATATAVDKAGVSTAAVKPAARPAAVTTSAGAATASADPPTPGGDKPAATGDKRAGSGSDRLRPVVDAIKEHRSGFRACFDQWSKSHPGVSGHVTLSFYLDPEGNLDQPDAETSGFDAAEVKGCIEEFARTLRYPKSPSGKFTRFSYPFDFKATR